MAAHGSTATALRKAIENAGVEFIDENGGGPGVRLRKRQQRNPRSCPLSSTRSISKAALPIRLTDGGSSACRGYPGKVEPLSPSFGHVKAETAIWSGPF